MNYLIQRRPLERIKEIVEEMRPLERRPVTLVPKEINGFTIFEEPKIKREWYPNGRPKSIELSAKSAVRVHFQNAQGSRIELQPYRIDP